MGKVTEGDPTPLLNFDLIGHHVESSLTIMHDDQLNQIWQYCKIPQLYEQKSDINLRLQRMYGYTVRHKVGYSYTITFVHNNIME